jgi:hypothetical protein
MYAREIYASLRHGFTYRVASPALFAMTHLKPMRHASVIASLTGNFMVMVIGRVRRFIGAPPTRASGRNVMQRNPKVSAQS